MYPEPLCVQELAATELELPIGTPDAGGAFTTVEVAIRDGASVGAVSGEASNRSNLIGAEKGELFFCFSSSMARLFSREFVSLSKLDP